MIAYLSGTIINKSLNYVILETNNIGYQVFGGDNFLADLRIGASAEIYIHHHIREEANDLYGFKSLGDLELFEMLLTVSGVGPKSALGVLNIATGDDVKEAIFRGDASLLTKVAGIGNKSAERIILELKNKVVRPSGAVNPLGVGLSSGGDEIDALMSLGYSLSEARAALNAVEPEIHDSGARVKEALKKMARK
jgi:Holliday junction DNA helicase RuvA